jgi:hypothetical protein
MLLLLQNSSNELIPLCIISAITCNAFRIVGYVDVMKLLTGNFKRLIYLLSYFMTYLFRECSWCSVSIWTNFSNCALTLVSCSNWMIHTLHVCAFFANTSSLSRSTAANEWREGNDNTTIGNIIEQQNTA